MKSIIKEIDLDILENKIDSLNSKEQQKDWANQLTSIQTIVINKGKKDVVENRIYSDKTAKEMIKEYVKSKFKY